MQHTVKCDDSVVISIPLGRLRSAQEGQLMPEDFSCIVRDPYKVFLNGGKPKPLGAAQAIAGVFILCLGIIFWYPLLVHLPNVVFIVTGMLSCATGHFPNKCIAKLCLFLNIVSVLWSLTAGVICSFSGHHYDWQMRSEEINGIILFLLVLELAMAVFMTYHLSKAVLRHNFNVHAQYNAETGGLIFNIWNSIN